MKKPLIITGMICAVLLVSLTAILFIVQTGMTNAFIMGYIFLVISIAAQLIVPALHKNRDNLEFLYAPKAIVCGIYFIIQLIITFLTALIDDMSFRMVLVSELILLCLFAVTMLTVSAAVRIIQKSDSSGGYNFYDYAKREIKLIITEVSDKALKKELERVSDDLSFGSSTPDSLITEDKIRQTLQSIREAVGSNNIFETRQQLPKLKMLINQRNILCR